MKLRFKYDSNPNVWMQKLEAHQMSNHLQKQTLQQNALGLVR